MEYQDKRLSGFYQVNQLEQEVISFPALYLL